MRGSIDICSGSTNRCFFDLEMSKYLEKYASNEKNVHNKNFIFEGKKRLCKNLPQTPPPEGRRRVTLKFQIGTSIFYQILLIRIRTRIWVT